MECGLIDVVGQRLVLIVILIDHLQFGLGVFLSLLVNFILGVYHMGGTVETGLKDIEIGRLQRIID